MSVLSEIIRDNRFRQADLEGFQDKLFFEGSRRQPYLVKFFVLLFLATVIAAYGVLNDSTATVIGAMIVAPLMTPIMATAAALVMGNFERSIHSISLVISGMFLVIIVAILIGAAHSGVISFTQNTQIIGRISPRTTDLLIALASGAAGAFAYSRDDIADSLPGVAIAISLVPPLCVVGISLSQGQWTAAYGAMLLYMTNFLAILLAGGGVLAFLGLASAATQTLEGFSRRRAFTVITMGVLLIAIPLAATSVRVARDSWIQYRTAQLVQAWLVDTDYDLEDVQVGETTVQVVIAGEGETPPLSDLVASASMYDSRVTSLELIIVPTEVEYVDLSTYSE